jgi:glycosyltransferase involved in cell wall biosynthesis
MGGYELSCRDVVDRWRARGHEVLVLTTDTTVSGVVEPGVAEPHVRRQLRWYWSEHVFVRPTVRERLRLERANSRALRAAVAELRPDVVSVWHMGGMSLSLLTTLEDLGLPVVLNICDEWPRYTPERDAWLHGWSSLPSAVRAVGARVTGQPTRLPDLDRHAASVVSDYILRCLRERTQWSFPAAVVAGSGVDLDDFPLAPLPREKPWRGELLAVGRVEPRKGFDTVVAALPHLPEMRLRIAGVADPAHLRELDKVAVELGVEDRVTIAAVPRSELCQLYADADAVVFPSRWDEPFGLVPLEAMTQATPVVATRRGGSGEFLVDGANCLEIPADDPLALAAAVRRLADDPQLRARLAAGGLSTAAEHTVDRLAGVLEELHLSSCRAASVSG